MLDELKALWASICRAAIDQRLTNPMIDKLRQMMKASRSRQLIPGGAKLWPYCRCVCLPAPPRFPSDEYYLTLSLVKAGFLWDMNEFGSSSEIAPATTPAAAKSGRGCFEEVAAHLLYILNPPSRASKALAIDFLRWCSERLPNPPSTGVMFAYSYALAVLTTHKLNISKRKAALRDLSDEDCRTVRNWIREASQLI